MQRDWPIGLHCHNSMQDSAGALQVDVEHHGMLQMLAFYEKLHKSRRA